MAKLIDLTGKRTGHVVVLGKAESKGNKGTLWKCMCDCGSECVLSYYKLTRAKDPSCGCASLQNKMIGRRFGRLTVIEGKGSEKGKALWLCQCDCGNECVTTGDRLRSGHCKSCGCLKHESNNPCQHSANGMSGTRIYRIWKGMIIRCYHENDHSYKDYGGRGVVVYDEWRGEGGFSRFYDWAISHGYKDDLTIDRIDTNGNYEPDNCRWTTMEEQSNNRRNTRMYTINGKTDSLANWCRIYGVSYNLVERRIRRDKYDIVTALTKPCKKHKISDK